MAMKGTQFSTATNCCSIGTCPTIHIIHFFSNDDPELKSIFNPWDIKHSYSSSPVSYCLTVDDVVVISGAWNSMLENITYLADGLSVGAHTFVLSVTDIGGNTATDTVLITVLLGDSTALTVAIGVGGTLIAAIIILYIVRKKGASS